MPAAWTPSSWENLDAKQQPTWPNADELSRALREIEAQPPLVFAGEARQLQTQLARVSRGEAFLLQGGDCAETFEAFSADQAHRRPVRQATLGRHRDP
jgi:3-deoxy-7-phosphoheptulonate synthase